MPCSTWATLSAAFTGAVIISDYVVSFDHLTVVWTILLLKLRNCKVTWTSNNNYYYFSGAISLFTLSPAGSLMLWRWYGVMLNFVDPHCDHSSWDSCLMGKIKAHSQVWRLYKWCFFSVCETHCPLSLSSTMLVQKLAYVCWPHMAIKDY